MPGLALLLSACAASSDLSHDIAARIDDAQIWNDRMPGAPRACHAVMHVRLTNTTNSDIVLLRAEGMIVEPFRNAPMRRFPAIMLYRDIETQEVRLPPGTDIELAVRTPVGVPPIDMRAYPLAKLSVRFSTSLDRFLTISSDAVRIFETQ